MTLYRLRCSVVAALAAFALPCVAQRKPPEPSPEKARVHITSTPSTATFMLMESSTAIPHPTLCFQSGSTW